MPAHQHNFLALADMTAVGTALTMVDASHSPSILIVARRLNTLPNLLQCRTCPVVSFTLLQLGHHFVTDSSHFERR